MSSVIEIELTGDSSIFELNNHTRMVWNTWRSETYNIPALTFHCYKKGGASFRELANIVISRICERGNCDVVILKTIVDFLNVYTACARNDTNSVLYYQTYLNCVGDMIKQIKSNFPKLQLIIIGPHNILPEKEIWACDPYGIDLAKKFDLDLESVITSQASYVSCIKEFNNSCCLESDPSFFAPRLCSGLHLTYVAKRILGVRLSKCLLNILSSGECRSF